MRVFAFLMFVLTSQIKAQDSWSVTPQIEFDLYTTYSGTIDGKYPIFMYLKESYEPCKQGGLRNTPRIVYGWYMYQKIGKKIPLVGHVCYADACESSVKLFVPDNIFDYYFDDNCDVPLAKEVFEEQHGHNSMTWRKGKGNPVPVELKIEHKYSWSTKAQLKLNINNMEVSSLDLNKIADNVYIEEIEILGKKIKDGYLHLILTYSHQSNPGSYGQGSCGAGLEEYIAYIKIDKNFEVHTFDKIQTSSCINSLYETDVIYDKDNPEFGIRNK